MAILSNDTLSGCTKIPSFIEGGTTMLFQQTSAPTSWTKSTTHDNKALRVVSGSIVDGGAQPFTSIFSPKTFTGSANNVSLTSAQTGSHSHGTISTLVRLAISDTPFQAFGVGGDPTAIYPLNPDPMSSTGTWPSVSSHSHPITTSAIDFTVAYVDVILATKDV